MQLPTHVQEHIDSIKTVDYFSGSGPLRAGCRVYAARGAARDAARGAARDAAWDAAWDAARAAARDAARDAAWEAAWDAAWNAARVATRYATRDAAWDAALLAVCLLMQDRIDPEHLEYARLRWSIWQAGYGVAAEVDGVHYCYRRP